MNITKGKIQKAQAVVIYGVEGIGKSTFASLFPKPLFIDTEDSTTHLDVARTDKPSSWTIFKQILADFKADNMGYKTLVIDTVDWLEHMVAQYLCDQHQKESIESFGYGKGFTMISEEWGKFLNFLIEIKNSGVNVVLVAHSHLRKIELPEETGAFDKYELKLSKKVAPLTKEWADCVLFANFKTLVVDVDGKKKAQGAKRVMYTTHHACWDAKNRWGLKEELPFDFDQIVSHILADTNPAPQQPEPAPTPEKEPALDFNAVEKQIEDEKQERQAIQEPAPEPQQTNTKIPQTDPVAFNTALYDLMKANNVTAEEIQKAVAYKGYYPRETPIDCYDEGFVNGCLIAAFDKVHEIIKEQRSN